ncbi:MAG: alpha/beta fold hydrolase [Caldilineaceae bacterium]
MLFRLLLIPIVLYLALCLLLYLRQERLLFYPTVLAADYRYSFSVPFEELSIPVNGAVLNVVHFRAAQPKGIVFYLHGNGDIIGFLGDTAEDFVALDYDLFMPDYRGYGKSTGTLDNETTFYNDMTVAYAYVHQHFLNLPIIIYGHSIGSGIAVHLAAENDPQRLILESPYYSLQSLVAEKMSWVPTSLLLKYPLRSDQWIERVTVPITLIHGTADTLIPYENSMRLLELIHGEKQLVTVEGGGHGNLRRSREWQEAMRKLLG